MFPIFFSLDDIRMGPHTRMQMFNSESLLLTVKELRLLIDGLGQRGQASGRTVHHWVLGPGRCWS